jgi:hypothetical protein
MSDRRAGNGFKVFEDIFVTRDLAGAEMGDKGLVISGLGVVAGRCLFFDRMMMGRMIFSLEGAVGIEHRTSNIEHRTSNIEHRTSNVER